MTYLFNRPNHDLLETFAWSNVLLAFDYDGTLAPLVSAPKRATMRASTRQLLRRASKLYPCVVISGRAQGDALGRLRGVEVCRVVGNHGAEPSPNAEATRRRVQQWVPVLKARLRRRQGVVIEDKGFSVAVHYRQARERSSTRRAVLAAARSLKDVRIVGGKLVVNFLVPDAPHKGLALERERSHFACDTVIYVGDDETDEDVFQLDRPGQLLSIRVGRKQASAAPYYIRNQAEIDRLLEILVTLRGDHRD
ncbi:MAG: trehalose-phosphatase [Acidobacteria bacterium RIFCSPLOWO2_02_FULL_65_29]|nr:MAG: trehalose-phosphatase [Acidobacteria bacterium RIFCSPLOWO2_02_FULL_65_29]